MKKTLAIKSTVYPERTLSFNDLQLHIRQQLTVEVPKHRKPNKFHLNVFKS